MINRKIKTRIEVKNEATSDTSKLYLYGGISESESWLDDESITPKMVREYLDQVEGKDLEVHLNSTGGCVFSSISISNMLKQFKGEVTIYVDGLAASGGSVIAMSGNKVVMPMNSMLMIHQASTLGFGTSTNFRKLADDLDKIDISVKESYKERFVGSEEELVDLINAETWLTAEECLAFGFCDEIIDAVEEKQEPKEEINVKENLFAKYKKETPVNEIEIKSNLFNKFKNGGNK